MIEDLPSQYDRERVPASDPRVRIAVLEQRVTELEHQVTDLRRALRDAYASPELRPDRMGIE